MLDERVKVYLEEHREATLAKLIELLRFASVANAADDGCGSCAAWLAEYLRSIGFKADVLPTAGQPCVLAERKAGDDLPTLLVYGHYDVQPPDPMELWQSPPFEPEIREEKLFARGASDDKGQLFMHIAAAAAWIDAAGELPLNLTFIIEGEEEIGSPSIEDFLVEHADRLSADALVISDTTFFAPGVPAITNGLRGLCGFEVTFHGPNRDVHSGVEGGLIVNPINALCALIGAMYDENGRVRIDGFYDDVEDVPPERLEEWRSLPFDEAAHAAELGVESLSGGERDCVPLVRNWARPTLDVNGITGGYQGRGAKTIIPARASAKITMRLAARQDPQKIIAALERFVERHTPAGIRAEVDVHASARPVLLPNDTPAARAGADAMAEAFGRPPVWVRNGASVPITETFQRVLGLDAVLLGFGLPGDNIHSPNEHIALGQLFGGAEMAASFMQRLAEGG